MFELIVAEETFLKLQEMQRDADKQDLLLSGMVNIASDNGFDVVKNDGDGNCMFHALCHQLKYEKHLEISHQELRKQLVKYLHGHPKLVSVNKEKKSIMSIMFIIKPYMADFSSNTVFNNESINPHRIGKLLAQLFRHEDLLRFVPR